MTVDISVSIYSPEEVKMCEGCPLHLVIHSRDDIRESHDSVQNVPRHGEIVIVTPVKRHRSGHVSQGVLGHLVRPVVLIVGLILAPVVGVEAVVFVLLLGVVEDSVGAGSGWSVVKDVGKESFVHLGLVKAAENEEDVGAEALSDGLVTEEGGQAVHRRLLGRNSPTPISSIRKSNIP